MLDSIRAAAKTPVAKGLLIVLGISFAIWGVKGAITPSRDAAIAHIGKFTVTPQEYQRVLNRQIEAMRKQFGDTFDAAQAHMFGLDTQILKSLIAGAALDEAARKMGLTTPDDAIVKQTREQKTFYGPDGRFSQAQFLEVLRRSGYNEASFFEAVRRDITRAQLQDALAAGFVGPDAIAKPLYRFHTEKRVVRYVVIAPEAVSGASPPTDDELKAYYDAHSSEYRTPEYRKFSYVLLDPGALAKTLTVDDAKAREYFEFHKAEFGQAETRAIEQIVFPSEAAATAARAAIASGTSFEDAAKAAGFSSDDIKLGTHTAKELAKAIADAAFALPKDTVSEPVKTQFGFSLLRVTAITEGHEATFADARPAVDAQLAKDEADEKIYELGNTLEDKRQSGESLEDAAKSVGVEVRVVASTDADGRGPDGAPIAELDGQSELLSEAFKAVPSEESNLVPTAAGGYVAFRVDAVTAPTEKPFEEVKGDVRETLAAQARGKALDAKAAALLERAKAGTSLDTIAGELGRVVQTSDQIQRGASNETFSAETVNTIFGTEKDGFATGAVGMGDSRLLMQVSQIVPPTDEAIASDLPEIRKQLAELFANETLATYAGHAEAVANVKYNQAVLQSVLNPGDEAQSP